MCKNMCRWGTGLLLLFVMASVGGCIQATYPTTFGPYGGRTDEEKENHRLDKAIKDAQENQEDLLKDIRKYESKPDRR